MAKSAPSKHHLAACVKQAKAEGYADLIVATKGRRVILSGMVNGALCHAVTVSEHRTAEKALEQAIACKRWLRDMLPGERAPQLAGQVIIPVDTGISTSRTIIPASIAKETTTPMYSCTPPFTLGSCVTASTACGRCWMKWRPTPDMPATRMLDCVSDDVLHLPYL